MSNTLVLHLAMVADDKHTRDGTYECTGFTRIAESGTKFRVAECGEALARDRFCGEEILGNPGRRQSIPTDGAAEEDAGNFQLELSQHSFGNNLCLMLRKNVLALVMLIVFMSIMDPTHPRLDHLRRKQMELSGGES